MAALQRADTNNVQVETESHAWMRLQAWKDMRERAAARRRDADARHRPAGVRRLSPAPPTCACAIRCCRRSLASSASRIGGPAAIVTAFALAYGLFQLVVGPLGDARGKLRMVVLGSLVGWRRHADLRGHAKARRARGAALPGRRRAAAIIPLAIAWLGDVIPYERRQPSWRASLGADPGHRLRPGCGRYPRRAGRLARRLLLVGRSPYRGRPAAGREMRRLDARHAAARPRALGRRCACRLRRAAAALGAHLLGTTFIEGLLMFGAFAYVGADLHQRFGLGLGLVGLTSPLSASARSSTRFGRRHLVRAARPAGLAGCGPCAGRGLLVLRLHALALARAARRRPLGLGF